MRCLALAGALAAGACGSGGLPDSDAGSGATPGRLDILLITADTLRPDALGWIAGANSTPALDAFALGGVAFPAAVAPAPLTLPSHTSMFSGYIPRRHGVRDNHQVVGSAPPLLAERLAAAGYDTAAVISGFPLSAGFGLDRGFLHYSDEFTAGDGAWLERPAAETAAAAGAILGELRSPWFLWVHFYDPHYPYVPPEEFAAEGFRAGYDGEVSYVDREVGRLLDKARAASPEDLLSVFTADHGEALGEHGENTHGFFVYDDTMLVPLVFHWPGHIEPARRSESVRLVDLAPTLLDLIGLEPFRDVDGVSLRPLLEGRDLAPPAAYLETMQPWNSYGWSPLAAIRHDGWKLIDAPRPELYDLTVDPAEADNLYDRRQDRARELERRLGEAESRPEAVAAAIEDTAVLEQLRALGYVGSGGKPTTPARGGLRDPKDQVELRAMLTRADESLRLGDFRTAERWCRQALAQDPQNRFARLRLGLSLRGRGALSEALVELERALSMSPDDPEARAAYAEALTAAGRPGDAVPQWMEVVRAQPRRVVAWSNLGATQGLSGQPDRAVAAYEQAAALDPDNPERWIRLGFAAYGAGRSADAAAHLERAAGLDADGAFPHAGALGLILQQLDRNAEAATWLERCDPAETEFPQARLALARMRLAEGQRTAARRLLLEGMRARPELRALALTDPELGTLLADSVR